MKRWLERGAAIPSGAVRWLENELDAVTDPWTRQHLCQSVRHLGLDALDGPRAARWATALDRWRREPRPLLRAWAMDALVYLAGEHRELEAAGRTALAEAFRDPAPSVRARARRIQSGG